LATDLVELHGLEAGRDVDIQFIGLRPGEKLTEELTFADEQLEPTDHEAILRVRHTDGGAGLDDNALSALRAAAAELDRRSIVRSLCELVPQYRPSELYAT
jgi:FlaA1/EpsC-like NDP-sugar epimerase